MSASAHVAALGRSCPRASLSDRCSSSKLRSRLTIAKRARSASTGQKKNAVVSDSFTKHKGSLEQSALFKQKCSGDVMDDVTPSSDSKVIVEKEINSETFKIKHSEMCLSSTPYKFPGNIFSCFNIKHVTRVLFNSEY